MDKKNISETNLILDIIRRDVEFSNSLEFQQKEVYINNHNPEFWKFYLVYGFGIDNIVVYGSQDSNEIKDNKIDYINLYYYKTGTISIKNKIATLIKKGYDKQLMNFKLSGLRDRVDDFVWKINFLFNKLFVVESLVNGDRFKEDIIKYINQVSTIKYVYCNHTNNTLSKKNMEYMNEIYKKVREDK